MGLGLVEDCDHLFLFKNLQVVASVKERTDEKFVPDSYISGSYLTRCFERKGGKPAGFIAGFQDQYARFGRKKVC